MRWFATLLAIALNLPGQSAGDLGNLDLQDLLNLKVTSVQRKEQVLSRSAAAVTVLTRADIRSAGVSSLPEALRLVPGLYVARATSGVWAIGSRGFTGQFSNKLLVLVDGRSVYHPLNSGVFWDNLDLMLDDIERIEVIRGPGAVMWGANAVTGVINIITRDVKGTLGGLVEVESGTEDRVVTRMRYGRRLSEAVALRISGQHAIRSGLTSVVDGERRWPLRTNQGGFRLDWDRSEREQLVFIGDLLTSDIKQTYTIRGGDGKKIARVAPTEATGGSLHGRWSRAMWRGQTIAQMSYSALDHAREDYIEARFKTLDVDIHHRVGVARKHDLLIGAGYRTTEDSTSQTAMGRMAPASDRYGIAAFTAQHEYQILLDRLFLTSGVRLERSTLGGANPQPTLRVLWRPSGRFVLWGAVSQAVRTPSRTERDMELSLSAALTPRGVVMVRKVGNPDFGPERLRAWEGGFRASMKNRFAADVSLFRNAYDDLDVWVEGAPQLRSDPPGWTLPLRSVNGGRNRGYGGEVSLKAEIGHGWGITASASGYRSHTTALVTGASKAPEDIYSPFQSQFVSTYDFSRRAQWGVVWLHTARTAGSQKIRAHDRLDTNVQWRFSEWSGITVGVRNLDGGMVEYRPEDGASRHRTRRTAFVRIQFWF